MSPHSFVGKGDLLKGKNFEVGPVRKLDLGRVELNQEGPKSEVT